MIHRRGLGTRRLAALDDLQAGITRGVGHPTAHYLFVRIDRAESARSLLSRLVPAVGSSADWGSTKPAVVRNVAISARGLQNMDIDPATIALFGEAFTKGMAGRADHIGDTGANAPANWVAPFASGDAQLLIWLHGESLDALDADVDRWRREIERVELPIVYERAAGLHSDAREHFGFADGLGQPRLDGALHDAFETGVVDKHGDHSLPAGEFIHGYADALGALSPPSSTRLGQSTTMLVMRQLRQHVAAFRGDMHRIGADLGMTADQMSARVVGRWQDGSPLSCFPDAPPPPDDGSARSTPFSYSNDPDGLRCPIGAHIRRANPRDELRSAATVTRHRIIRRALPYGPVLPPGIDDDGGDRGLMFGCLNGDIGRQFEFVQRSWLNDGGPVRCGDRRDILVGMQGTNQFVLGGDPPRTVDGFKSYVSTAGGEYYLMPGLAALRWLTHSHAEVSDRFSHDPEDEARDGR